jgi:hypothetical protein
MRFLEFFVILLCFIMYDKIYPMAKMKIIANAKYCINLIKKCIGTIGLTDRSNTIVL